MQENSRRSADGEKPGLGDRFSRYCVIDGDGEVIEEGWIQTKGAALEGHFAGEPRQRTAIEYRTHSPLMSRLLQGMGHEVFVANARKVRAITGSELKNDRNDAEKLALFAPHDVRLLSPIQHRSPERQRDLSLLQTRDTLVRARTMLVNAMRGLVKSTGQRLPKCSTESFADSDSGGMQPALTPMLEQVTSLTEQIRKMDKQIEALGNNIPKVVRLRSVPGVGPSGCSCVHVEAGLPRDSGKEPGGGRLPGIRAAAKPIRGVRSAATDQ